MDLTVPSGASSVSGPLIGVGRWEAGTDLSVRGEMNRSLLVSLSSTSFVDSRMRREAYLW